MSNLLIFDLDGTLVDSRKDIANSLNFALKKEGFATLPQQQIEDLVGWGARQLVEEALGNPSEEDLLRVFQSFWNHYDQHLLDETGLYPDVLEFLERTSHWHKAVITNKPQGFSEKIIQGLGLGSYFSWVIGGDALSVRKPHPGVLEAITGELGEISQGMMIGDSIVDMEFGKATGLLTCALTHGFGIKSELEATAPDYIVENFSQLGRLEIFRNSAVEIK